MCECDLDDEEDELCCATIELLRNSYGEDKILSLAESLTADGDLDLDFNTDSLVAAIRQSLPQPEAEGAKPIHLTNYRSEAAEVVARLALAELRPIVYPVHPQQGKANANQPILGFDGWGLLLEDPNPPVLGLLQVKATDEDKRPPGVANDLDAECRACVVGKDKLARALAVMTAALDPADKVIAKALLGMLSALGDSALPPILVVPVVVRGTSSPSLDDLEPIRESAKLGAYSPAVAHGVSLGLGVNLNDFGKTVATRARKRPE